MITQRKVMLKYDKQSKKTQQKIRSGREKIGEKRKKVKATVKKYI
jgi:hypothetical protein